MFVIFPKDIWVAGMKAEIAYQQTTFMSFKNILKEKGAVSFSGEKRHVKWGGGRQKGEGETDRQVGA